MSWQPPPEPDYNPKKKMSAREFLTHPVFLLMVAIMAIGIWFGSSFIHRAMNPTPENTVNYYGVAEILDKRSSTLHCYVDIKRDDGWITRQKMTRQACGDFDEGDVINMENGQYVSHVSTQG